MPYGNFVPFQIDETLILEKQGDGSGLATSVDPCTATGPLSGEYSIYGLYPIGGYVMTVNKIDIL